ncbi:LPXTG cell wall anchor domain-containing protein [Frondihabitans sp. 762G35]|uniref:LPXTG cell wall anchor domain-containing protein n=1 Tax=Frondihabitans sp. 762G35 TaxID=1446794 RepID=UPI0013DA9759|nr:LPXTG cell wall anchor domain-containing protein [Frondihabitans sp. 762G35]
MAVPSSARAAIRFPFETTFDSAAGGTLSGSATTGGGWLSLTTSARTQAGSWTTDDAFDSSLGLDVTFQYATYGGSGGNGLSFFLADGAASASVGPPGAGLGYACVNNNATGSPCNQPGVAGAFVGIGLDEYGAFSDPNFLGTGPGQSRNSIAVRGSGTGTSGYRYLAGAVAPGGSVATGSRAGERTIRVIVQPDPSGTIALDVFSNTGPGTSLQPVFKDLVVTGPDQAALPPTLRLGFVGSTGDATNAHEIDDLRVNVPTDLAITTTGPVTAVAGTDIGYTVTATNASPYPVTGAAIADAIPAGITGVTWTCTSPDGGTCASDAGTGQDIATTADLPGGASVVYSIRGRADPSLAPQALTNTAIVTAPVDRADTDLANNRGSVSTQIEQDASLTTTKSAALLPSATELAPGEDFTYTLRAGVTGPSTATDVGVSDALPEGIDFVSSPDGCSATGKEVRCTSNGATLPGEGRSFRFTVRLNPAYVGDGTDLGNIATATSRTPGTSTSSPTVFPPTIVPRAALTTTKVAAVIGTGASVAPGETYSYTVTVRNGGPSYATDVGASDRLPDPLAFVSSGDGCTASGQLVTCASSERLAVGESTAFTFVVKLAASYTGTGEDLLNVASGTSTTPGASPPSAPAPPPPLAAPRADLTTDQSVSLIPPATSLVPGESFTYTISVANQGPSAAADVGAIDNLPGGILFQSSASGCTAEGQRVVCAGVGPPLAPGGKRSFTFTVRLDPSYIGDGSDLGNVASGSMSTSGTISPSEMVFPPEPLVDPVADLSITKSAAMVAPVADGSTDWTITVTNRGPSTAQDVLATDAVPQGLTFTGSVPSVCVPSGNSTIGNVAECSLGSLLPGETTTVILTTGVSSAVVAGTILRNSATVTSLTDDPVPENNRTGLVASIPVIGLPTPQPAPPNEPVLAFTGSRGVAPLAIGALLLLGLGAVLLIRRRRDPR